MAWLISKALYESWLCSQEQAVESLEDTCLDGEPSAQSSGSHTQLAYLLPDKMTAFSRLSRFGMTFKPLTADRGEDLLMWFRGDFLAKTYPAQERGAGIEGSRSSMWKHMARIIGEVRPRFAFVENSPLLVGRGAAMVIGDLAEMGYDAQWCIVSASDCGAPHQRDRFWLVAYSTELQCNGVNDNAGELLGRKQVPESGNDCGTQHMADTNSTQCKGNERAKRSEQERANISQPSWWSPEPNVGRVADGVAARMDRLKAIGNGQVSIVAATAWKILTGTTKE